jgi:hypothetical protein
LIEFSGQVAIEPIGTGGDAKNGGTGEVTTFPGQVVHPDKNRDKRDT